MTTYRLMDGASGRPGAGSSGTQPPAAGTSYSGNYLAGLVFNVTTGGTWFQGYWWWVPATVSQTTAQKFALWQVTGAAAGTLVPNSTVTSGALTAGQFNFVALATPLLLPPGVVYNAATGYSSSSGFPATHAQFGTGDPYSAGITNGPLTAYSSLSGSAPVLGNWLPQQPFSTAGSDPAVNMPVTNDADDLLWLDVQVTDVAPGGATYRAFPNMPATIGHSPQPVSYTLGMEFSLSVSCALDKIWHYSAPTSTVLPSRCGIWTVGSQTELAGSDNSGPSWLDPSGSAAAAGDGWVYCDYSGAGLVLAASTNYKVATFANAGASVWFAATTLFWSTGPGAAGFTIGPLSLPDNAAASPGQNSWNQGTTWTYPNTSASPENDWIDVEVTSLAATAGTASIAGAGAVTAAGQITGTANLTGAGTVTAKAVQVSAASAAGAGAVSASAFGVAAFTVGKLTASATGSGGATITVRAGTN